MFTNRREFFKLDKTPNFLMAVETKPFIAATYFFKILKAKYLNILMAKKTFEIL